jgi:hypothetical protein
MLFVAFSLLSDHVRPGEPVPLPPFGEAFFISPQSTPIRQFTVIRYRTLQ